MCCVCEYGGVYCYYLCVCDVVECDCDECVFDYF